MSDETPTNRLRLQWQPGDQSTTVVLDVRTWAGEVVEELEEHLGGEPVLAWARRMSDAMNRGFRVTEMRAKDVIGMVFLGRAHEAPGTTWRDVSRAVNPFTLRLVDGVEVDDDEPAEQAAPAAEPAAEPAQEAPRPVSPVVAALAERRVAEIGMPAVVLPDAQ